MVFGLLNLSFWGYVVATLLLTQTTIACVTIYLHRAEAHRALSLHPIVSHFFRFWLWLTTGMVTAEWVAIHRKHHAFTEKEGDPHSPKVVKGGLKKVLLEGAELYREAASDREMVERYAHGTPNDWIERNVYAKYSAFGIFLMMFLNLFLFGIPGISIWAIQMMWIPFHAAGIINGIGHYFGYRNFESQDASSNIIPWAFWIGGEELHNNHHTFASSAKFSVKWWEFDIGWFYIRILSFLRLAQVKKLPPKLAIDTKKTHVDIETIKAVISNRFQIMSSYYRDVIRPVLKIEKQKNKLEKSALFLSAGRLLRLQETLLTPAKKARLEALLESCEQLKMVYAYRKSLQNVWLTAAKTQKELVLALQQWCKQAEASGMEVLMRFSMQIKQSVPAVV